MGILDRIKEALRRVKEAIVPAVKSIRLRIPRVRVQRVKVPKVEVPEVKPIKIRVTPAKTIEIKPPAGEQFVGVESDTGNLIFTDGKKYIERDPTTLKKIDEYDTMDVEVSMSHETPGRKDPKRKPNPTVVEAHVVTKLPAIIAGATANRTVVLRLVDGVWRAFNDETLADRQRPVKENLLRYVKRMEKVGVEFRLRNQDPTTPLITGKKDTARYTLEISDEESASRSYEETFDIIEDLRRLSVRERRLRELLRRRRRKK